MTKVHTEQPLQADFTQDIPDTNEERDETFAVPEDDPRRREGHDKLEEMKENEGEVGMRDDNSTTGLAAPAGMPGGYVAPAESVSGATDPQVEASSLGVVDANEVNLNDSNYERRDKNDERGA